MICLCLRNGWEVRTGAGFQDGSPHERLGLRQSGECPAVVSASGLSEEHDLVLWLTLVEVNIQDTLS